MKKNSSPLPGSETAKITLSKILKMPLEKYITFIEQKINGTKFHKGKSLSFYAKIITKNVKNYQEDYKQLEKQLLKHFKMTYGELPKTNRLGG